MNQHEQEGVIKYTSNAIQRPISGSIDLNEFFRVRHELFSLGFIGEDEHGLGYGNLSIRLYSSPRFLITASQTSGLEWISSHELAEVLSVDLNRNCLTYAGFAQASSESMTHAALYQADSGIRAIVHIHSRKLWQAALDVYPTTKKDVAYGTPEMAFEVIRLHRAIRTQSGIMVLGGHQDGIISFGSTISEAFHLIRSMSS